LIIFAVAALAGACAPEGVDSAASSAAQRATVPDADSLMPPLPGYTTVDDAEPGEVAASLDHGPVPYEEVRRRIVLDERGFTSGSVTVITFVRTLQWLSRSWIMCMGTRIVVAFGLRVTR
jgi:hypothetical protein